MTSRRQKRTTTCGRSAFLRQRAAKADAKIQSATGTLIRVRRNYRSRAARRTRGSRGRRERWSRSTARCKRWASTKATQDGQRQIRRDGLRSTDRAIREVRARATARNAIRLRHRRCGEPAIAAARGRSAPAPHRSRLADAIRRSIRAVFSAVPSDGKRRQSADQLRDQLRRHGIARREAGRLSSSKSGSFGKRHRVVSFQAAAFRGRVGKMIKAPFENEMGRGVKYRHFISAHGETASARGPAAASMLPCVAKPGGRPYL